MKKKLIGMILIVLCIAAACALDMGDGKNTQDSKTNIINVENIDEAVKECSAQWQTKQGTKKYSAN